MRGYQRRFEQFSVGLKDMSDAALESKFVCGLKEEIQSEIQKLNPVGLEAKMLMAQIIEEDQVVQLKRSHGTSGNSNLSIKMLSSGRSRSRS